MKKILESKTKVRFQDCDPLNHLNNSKYIDYFINAREDQLIQNYDFNIFNLADDTGKSWVVTSNQIAYFRPANIMEDIVIESQLIKASNKTLQVEMRMWNYNKTELKSLYWVDFTYYNLIKQKSEQHSEEFQQFFNEIISPVNPVTFKERQKHIIQNLKK